MIEARRFMIGALSVAALGVAACTTPGGGGGGGGAPVTTRITNWDAASSTGTISADGAFVAYESSGSDTPGGPDDNGVSDIFLWDRVANTHSRVTPGAITDTGDSSGPSISGNGAFTAFTSHQAGLGGGSDPDDSIPDVFVYDRLGNTIDKVTDNSGLSGEARISEDGSKVAFVSDSPTLAGGDANFQGDVFVWDRVSDVITRLTAGDGASYNPAISSSGLYVAFISDATDLVGGDTNNNRDVFLYNTLTSTTIRITDLPTNTLTEEYGIEGGQHFGVTTLGDVFYNQTTADPLDPFVYTTMVTKKYTEATTLTSDVFTGPNKFLAAPPNADGIHIVYGEYASYPGSSGTIKVRNLVTDVNWTVSTGVVSPLSISADGRYALFSSDEATLLGPDNNGSATDLFLWNRNANW